VKLLGIVILQFDVTAQLLIRFSALVRYWRKNGSTMRQYTMKIRFTCSLVRYLVNYPGSLKRKFAEHGTGSLKKGRG
jgi:hypothetical protein